jgi:hypothetical protein
MIQYLSSILARRFGCPTTPAGWCCAVSEFLDHIQKRRSKNSQRPMDELSICTILSAFAIDTADPAESNLCDDLDD